MKRRPALYTLLALLTATWLAPIFAQEPKPDPKAQALMDQIVAAYRALPALQEKVSFTNNRAAMPGTASQALPVSLEFAWQKPNRFAIKYGEETAPGKVVRQEAVSDGAIFWLWRSDPNVATKYKALPKSLANPIPQAGLPELSILLSGEDPFKNVVGPGVGPFTAGNAEKIGDLAVDVLEAKVSEKDTPFGGTLRIKVGQSDHLIRYMSFEGNGKDADSGKDISFKMEASYEVNSAPTFPSGQFAFTPPPGAKVKIVGPPVPPPGKPTQPAVKPPKKR